MNGVVVSLPTGGAMDWKEEARKTGLPVFPVMIWKDGTKNRKKPLTPRGHLDASMDVDSFDWSQANGYGVPMGGGLYAFDPDDYKDGVDPDEWLRDEGLLDLPTRVHRTVSGGRHIVVRVPEGCEDLPTMKIDEGLDTRGLGGWIAFGEGYSVLDPSPPAEMPMGAYEKLRVLAANRVVAAGGDHRIDLPDLHDAAVSKEAKDLIVAHESLREALLNPNTDGSGTLFNVAAEAHRLGLTEDQYAGVVMVSGKSKARDHVLSQQDPERALGRAWKRSEKKAGTEDFAGLELGEDRAVAPSVRERELREFFGDEATDAFVAEQEEKRVEAELGPFQRKMAEAEVRSGFLAGFDPLAVDAQLLKGMIPVQGMGVVFGATGIGKSFVVTDMMLRLASGEDWHGYRNKAGDGDWIYISSEGGALELKRRLAGWCAVGGRDLPGNVRFYTTSFKWGRDGEDAANFVRWARKGGRKINMVVIDTLNRNMAGDENASVDMTAFVNVVETIWRSLGCFAVVVHHEGKDADKGARGSSVLPGATEFEWRLFRDKPSMFGGIVVRKNRSGEDGMKLGFELRKHDFGVDADGDRVSTLVVQDAAPPVGTKITRKYSTALVDAYEELVDPTGNGYVDSQTVIERAADLQEAADGRRTRPSIFRRELHDELVAKHGWTVVNDAVKSSTFGGF